MTRIRKFVSHKVFDVRFHSWLRPGSYTDVGKLLPIVVRIGPRNNYILDSVKAYSSAFVSENADEILTKLRKVSASVGNVDGPFYAVRRGPFNGIQKRLIVDDFKQVPYDLLKELS